MSIRLTETPREALWAAALRDAAGLLAAYITPPEFGLSAFSGEFTTGTDPFERSLRKRLDLGRAHRFAEMLATLAIQPDRLRRKSIRFTMGEVLGTVHIPKYLASLASGMPDRIPVLQSKYNKRTPENQLVVEGLERSLAVCRDWLGRGGAEAKLAHQLHQQLSQVLRIEPWRDLLNQPRPPLKPLAVQVRNLVSTRVIPREPYSDMSLLLGGLAPSAGAMAFTASAGLLSLLITSDPLFEDKLFELICLAWLIKALSQTADPTTLQVFPNGLKGSKGLPVAKAYVKGKGVSLFFQSGAVLPGRNWRYFSSGKDLRAIFDIVCRITSTDYSENINIIIDAKNRTAASESEVAYKMLGYKENILIEGERFLGMAIFPSDNRRLVVRSLYRNEHRLWLAFVPLGNAEGAIRLFGRLLGNRRLGF